MTKKTTTIVGILTLVIGLGVGFYFLTRIQESNLNAWLFGGCCLVFFGGIGLIAMGGETKNKKE